ncbi:MAG: MFS transporter [Spirochaetaceae bacterium]|jgi:MFS family permease|nr:MFS transporter [Spirochaetaceae bacterium]
MRILTSIYAAGARYRPFVATLALSGIAYGLYRGVQDNYLAEIVGITAFERGLVEFFREMPGLLVVFILALMHHFSDSRIFKIGTAICSLGLLGLLAGGTGKVFVVALMVVYSLGEHIIMPVRSSISMDLAQAGKGGESMGLTGSLGQIGNIAGFIIVIVLFRFFDANFKLIFALAAVLAVAASIISIFIKAPEEQPKRKKLYFAKKYRKYYMLEVFYGSRKQIFLTFAPYVMILVYGADASIISFLLAICAVFGAILSPVIGKLIDYLGYRFIMVLDTIILVPVCLIFGFAHVIFPKDIAFIIVCANFVLDSIISLASMASSVYVKDIADASEEVTATLSTGVSVNHVISILIALCGGFIWHSFGVELLFSLSAVLGIINSLYAATVTGLHSRGRLKAT